MVNNKPYHNTEKRTKQKSCQFFLLQSPVSIDNQKSKNMCFADGIFPWTNNFTIHLFLFRNVWKH